MSIAVNSEMITKNSKVGKSFLRTLLIILGVIIAIFLSLQSDLVGLETQLREILPQTAQAIPPKTPEAPNTNKISYQAVSIISDFGNLVIKELKR